MARRGEGGAGSGPDAPGRSAAPETTQPTAPKADAPKRVGRFTLLEELGRGGEGVVYAAYDPVLDRKVALKLLPRAEHAGAGPEAALREAQAMARVRHPAVVQVHDAGLADRRVFMVLEYVEGVTLAEHLASRDLPWREVLALYLRAGEGLCAAHVGGVVHGDFKPGNVLLGGDGRVRVTDFGLARVRGMAEGSAPARAAGTPAYMAPEVHRGHAADHRSDQFSFCVALYEGLYACRPFRWRDREELRAAVTEGRVRPPPADRSIPRRVRQAVLRGLSADPADRFPGMEPLLRALRGPLRRRRQLRGGGVALGAALLAGVAVGEATRSDRGASATCKERARRLTERWSAQRREQIGRRFAALDDELGAALGERALAALDRYVAQWAAAQAESCRHAGSEAELVRSLCLERAGRSVEGLLQVWEAPSLSTLLRSVEAVSNLPTPAGCRLEDVAGLMAGAASPAQAHRRERLRAALDEALGRQVAGDYQGGVELARQVLAEVGEGDRGPLRAEATVRLGMLRHYAGDYRAAARDLREGAWAAEAARMDHLSALARTVYVHVAGRHLGRTGEAREWIRHAQSALDRLDPADEGLRGRLLFYRAQIELDRGDEAAARADLLRALAVRARAEGARSTEVALVELELAQIALRVGEVEEAEARLGRGRAIYAEALGEAHPELAPFLHGLGRVALARGRWNEARTLLEESRARYGAMGPEGVPELGDVLVDLARLARRRGDLAGAERILRQAIAHITRSQGSTPSALARARRELKRVLDPGGRGAEVQVAGSADGLEGAIEVGDEVVGVLDPDGGSDEAVRDP